VQRKGFERIFAKPRGKLAHVFPAGVVEVLACGKNFNPLRAAATGDFQQPGVKTLVQK
jgi:hypothetical protein